MSIKLEDCLEQNERIHYYRGVIHNSQNIIDILEDIDILLDESDLLKWKWSSTKPHLEKDEPSTFNTYEFNEEKTLSKELHESEQISFIQSYLYETIDNVTKHYCDTHGFNVSNMTDLKVNKSYPGKHLGPHADSHGTDSSAKISLVVFFNENFEGGEMLFRKQKVLIKPQIGSILVYPSTDPFYHQPNLIKSGVKYTGTGFWF